MTYEIQEAWFELLQWCGKHIWLIIGGSVGILVLYGLVCYAIGSWQERRRAGRPVLYTNGKWTYTKRR